MSFTSPTSKDGPSTTDQVLHRAAATVKELHEGNAGVEGSAPSNKADAKASLATPLSASPTTRGPAKKAFKSVNSEGEVEESMSRCLVYCRQRPSNKHDFQDGATCIVSMQDGHRVVIKDGRHYNYDGTFEPSATQEEVFQAVAVPCLQHAFKGFCSALMCYGQTGTGKSYTMCNTDPENEGIIPRAARFLFSRIADLNTRGGDERCYSVVGQFVQIYRDHLGDLMVHDGKDRVDIHCDPVDGVSLTGCTSHALVDEAAFMRFYKEGNARRVVTATAMNPESSRGHTAMVIHIVSETPNDPMQGRTKGKITFIDLAGYERFSKTGISSDNTIMKDEAKTINASLLALGHVVSSLSSGSKHIPWRNSKLTRILQDSIGGRSRTSIILTIGPSSNHLYETTNSLHFGLRAMAVKVQAKVSITVDYEKLANKLMGLLDERDARINVLELQIASRDAERQELLDRYQQDRADLEARFERELEELAAAGATAEQIGKLTEVHNVEIQNLQDQQAEELGYQDEQHSKEINTLIKEQKHQEAKSLTAMRLAQESIVEVFQKKLDHARGGTNEDLIHALQQLSEKDAILATRASDTARLREHIAALIQQVRDLGGEPEEADADFTETYLDIAQVEEMKSRLDAEVERLRNKVVDLQTQLDRVTLICSDRNEQVGQLLEDNQQLRAQLRQTGAEMEDSTLELQRLKAKRADMVDQAELETLRLRMQADIDEITSERDELKADLEKARRAQKLAVRNGANGRRSIPCENGVGGELSVSWSDHPIPWGSPRTSPSNRQGRRASPASDKASPMHPVYERKARVLTQQLIRSCAANQARQKRIDQLEGLLREHNVTLPRWDAAAERVSVDTVAAPDRLSPPPQQRQQRQQQQEPQEQRSGNTEGDTEADEDPDIAAILQACDEEGAGYERILAQQERLLSQSRSSQEQQQRLVRTLTAQLQAAGLGPQEPAVDLQPFEALPVEDYTTLLRDLRTVNRRSLLHLLTRATGAATGRHRGRGEGSQRDGSATPEGAVLREELEDRDNQLGLKDELLLEKAAVTQYLAKISVRLIHQMEALGLTPCCTLPRSFQAMTHMEIDALAVQPEKPEGPEAQLQHEAGTERDRMDRLLNVISADREHQALILRQTEEKNKVLLEREGRAAETIRRLAEEKAHYERKLEQAERNHTRELMQAQFRLLESESARRAGLLQKVFGLFSA